MPTKSEEKIQENNKRLGRGLHRPMVMDRGKGNKLKTCCAVKYIEHQRGKRENDGITEDEGVSSPMSKTMLKKVIE